MDQTDNQNTDVSIGVVRTLNDIARLCGVSASTVSRVFNSEPGISRQTADRVMETARRYGFSPAKRKRPLSRTHLRLTVVLPDQAATDDNPFYEMGELLSAINGAFSRDKKVIETISFSDLAGASRKRFETTDGMIFAFGSVDEPLRDSLRAGRVPYIFLNRTIEGENYVSCNNYKGALRLRHHLARSGYSRVGYLGCRTIPVNTDRRRGYETGARECSARVDDALIREIDAVGSVDEETVHYFLDRGCDAVMCFNDNVAIRFIMALIGQGKRVPEDMAVTGFDDSPLRKAFSPSITTMSLSTYEIGFFAARWLRDNIQHRETRTIRLEVEGALMIGETT